MTYTFTGAVAYDRLGSSWRTAAGLRSVSVTDPATGLLPANLTQGGLAVSWLTADANSRYSFSCDVPGVVVDFGAGAEALYANEVPGLAVAAGGATNTAIDTHLGGDATGLVATVAGKLDSTVASSIYALVIGLGASNGTNDTSALNALLATAGGKTAKGKHGETYKISAPLILPSGVTLDMTGCTVALVLGSNCNMVNNAAVAAARTVMDAGITAAANILTSATAAFVAGDVGKTAYVWGAGASGANLVTTIASVTNSTTAVLAANAVTTVSAACLSVGPRDSNITIIGGTWDRGADTGGGYNLSHCLRFRRADGIRVRGVIGKSTGGKFFTHFADCTQFEASDFQLATASDGVHVNGPARAGIISNIRGTSGDDFMAMGCNDYPGYNDTYGPISGVAVSDLYPQNPSSAGAGCRMWAGPGMVMDDIQVSRVGGVLTTGTAAVSFQEDPTQANTVGGTFGVISVKDVFTRMGSSATGKSAFLFGNSGTVKTLTIDGVTHRPSKAGVSAINLSPAGGGTGGTIQSLVIRRLTALSFGGAGAYAVIVNAVTVNSLVLDQPSMPDGSTGATFVYLLGGTVGQLEINNANLVFGDGTSNVVTVDGTSTMGRVVYNGGSITAGRSLVDTVAGAAGTTQVAVNGTRAVGINRFSNCMSPMEWDLNGVFVSNPLAQLFYLGNAASTLKLRGSAMGTVGTVNMFLRSAAQPINISAPALKADLALLAKGNGDSCYNTNAALAPVTGTAAGLVGPCVCDGTYWHNLASGSTY